MLARRQLTPPRRELPPATAADPEGREGGDPCRREQTGVPTHFACRPWAAGYDGPWGFQLQYGQPSTAPPPECPRGGGCRDAVPLPGTVGGGPHGTAAMGMGGKKPHGYASLPGGDEPPGDDLAYQQPAKSISPPTSPSPATPKLAHTECMPKKDFTSPHGSSGRHSDQEQQMKTSHSTQKGKANPGGWGGHTRDKTNFLEPVYPEAAGTVPDTKIRK